MDRKKELINVSQQLFDIAVEGKRLVSNTIDLTYDERNRLFDSFEECRVQAERLKSMVGSLQSKTLRTC